MRRALLLGRSRFWSAPLEHQDSLGDGGGCLLPIPLLACLLDWQVCPIGEPRLPLQKRHRASLPPLGKVGAHRAIFGLWFVHRGCRLARLLQLVRPRHSRVALKAS